eukprot:483376_1
MEDAQATVAIRFHRADLLRQIHFQSILRRGRLFFGFGRERHRLAQCSRLFPDMLARSHYFIACLLGARPVVIFSNRADTVHAPLHIAIWYQFECATVSGRGTPAPYTGRGGPSDTFPLPCPLRPQSTTFNGDTWRCISVVRRYLAEKFKVIKVVGVSLKSLFQEKRDKPRSSKICDRLSGGKKCALFLQ